MMRNYAYFYCNSDEQNKISKKAILPNVATFSTITPNANFTIPAKIKYLRGETNEISNN